MKNEIRVNSLELIQAADQAQLIVDAMDVSIEKWENQGEVSISLQAFSEQFYQMEKTMQRYQMLLNQDMKAIKEIARELFLSDFKLVELWRAK